METVSTRASATRCAPAPLQRGRLSMETVRLKRVSAPVVHMVWLNEADSRWRR